MTKAVLIFVVLGGIVALVVSCGKNTAQAPAPKLSCSMNITWQQVSVIFSSNCTNTCHKPNAQASFAVFTSYDKVKAYIQNKESLFRGNVIDPRTAYMPLGTGPLPAATRDTLNCWILNGMPEN